MTSHKWPWLHSPITGGVLDPELQMIAKVSVLAASVFSGLIGYTILMRSKPNNS